MKIPLPEGSTQAHHQLLEDSIAMKIILATIIAISAATPSLAGDYQPGYSSSRTCTRNEYREEYVPGTRDKPGYVRSWEETVNVSCDSNRTSRTQQEVDNNDCKEGTILGGLLGGGLGGMVSRGNGRWLAVPAGAVAGSMIGCQVDGG